MQIGTQKMDQVDVALKISEQGYYEYSPINTSDTSEIVKLNIWPNAEILSADDIETLVKGHKSPDWIELLQGQNLKKAKASIMRITTKRESITDSILSLRYVDGSTVGVLNITSSQHMDIVPMMCCVPGQYLAGVSDLRFQQMRVNEYFQKGQGNESPCFTDDAVWCRVTLFKNSEGKLLASPFAVNVLTCAAVDLTAFAKNGDDIEKAETIMRDRMRKMLLLLAERGCKHLILHASQYSNISLQQLEDTWLHLFCDEELWTRFEQIVFSVGVEGNMRIAKRLITRCSRQVEEKLRQLNLSAN